MKSSQLTIGFISQDWSHVNELSYPNGCTWYRCILPAIAINKSGGNCHVGSIYVSGDKVGLMAKKPLYEKSGVYSGHKIIVFKLPMHVLNMAAVDMCLSRGVKVVVDIDDWFDDLPDSNKAKEQTDPDKNKENNRDIYFKVIEMADALICSTPFLYNFYASKHPGKPIFMVRNSIDLGRWPKRSVRKSIPTIGWVGATPWRSNDLEQLSGFLQTYLESRGNKFHHAGHIKSANSAASLLGISEDFVTTEPMKPITQLPELFMNMDIGLVPLNRVDFNNAKSYLKGLEYVAAGLPFIASVSQEYEFLANAGVGRIARTSEEWIYHLDELQNYKMRIDESCVNLDIVRETFSIEKFSKSWVDTYNKIMDI